MIPKRIFTHWISDKPMPELVKYCVETQKLPGYEHVITTLDNCYKGSVYVQECIAHKRWVKASDWLRMWELHTMGGIYLDGDMEVLPGKNFDALLDHKIFLSKEAGGYWANAALGAVPGLPVFKEYLRRVEDNYRGSGEDVFSPGIRCFTDIFWEAVHSSSENIFECPVECFFPYNHLTGVTQVTEKSIVFHHYMTTWMDRRKQREKTGSSTGNASGSN